MKSEKKKNEVVVRDDIKEFLKIGEEMKYGCAPYLSKGKNVGLTLDRHHANKIVQSLEDQYIFAIIQSKNVDFNLLKISAEHCNNDVQETMERYNSIVPIPRHLNIDETKRLLRKVYDING